MSREIKFRAWDKKDKKYIIPDRLALDDDGALDFYVYNGGGYTLECFIVEQYTGIKDKNGKEIYEGDVVKWLNGLGEYTEFRVEWQDNRARVCLRNEYSEYDYEGLNDKKELYLEVIGNIHENPELLGGEDGN